MRIRLIDMSAFVEVDSEIQFRQMALDPFSHGQAIGASDWLLVLWTQQTKNPSEFVVQPRVDRVLIKGLIEGYLGGVKTPVILKETNIGRPNVRIRTGCLRGPMVVVFCILESSAYLVHAPRGIEQVA
jgi:hypothetical protein